MKATDLLRAFGRIVTGYNPCLSVEITRECPLSCPGCYAYGNDHLGGSVQLRQVSDHRGEDLVNGILELVQKHKPLHLSIVGGEPLVRFRELSQLLPELEKRKIVTQIVTSAVRPIPMEWAHFARLQICVSVDGLQPEHDARRSPATYSRILRNIEGHQITVHCTVTAQQTKPGYLEHFAEFWSAQNATKQIWFSLYTPQTGERSAERLSSRDRELVIAQLRRLRAGFPKVKMPEPLLAVYEAPPSSPSECIFAKTTTCLTADLQTKLSPCQFGGTPDCTNCGCMASAGLAAVARHRLPLGVQVGSIFDLSTWMGAKMNRARAVLLRD